MQRWIAIVVVAPWAAWAVGRTLGLDRVHPLIAIVAFTPYAALTAPVPVLVALVLRRRGAALVALAAAVLLAIAVLPRGVDVGSVDSDAVPVTVMTSNLYGGRADAERVVALARRHDVDVLVLQELTHAALARLDAEGVDVTLPHEVTEARPGGAGNAILSRYPLRRVPEWSLSHEPAAEVAIRRRATLRVRVVHPRPPVRRAAAREWRARLRALPSPGRTPAVLAGDFNATLDHRDLRRLLDRGWRDASANAGKGLKPTWPVNRRVLGLTIDHVLASAAVDVGDVRVVEVPGTDHRAVIAELGVRPAS